MSKTVNVKRLVLNINGKEISLTLDEAKELSEVLGELFEEKTEVKIVEVEKEKWYPWTYPYPTVTYEVKPDWTYRWWSIGTNSTASTDGVLQLNTVY